MLERKELFDKDIQGCGVVQGEVALFMHEGQRVAATGNRDLLEFMNVNRRISVLRVFNGRLHEAIRFSVSRN